MVRGRTSEKAASGSNGNAWGCETCCRIMYAVRMPNVYQLECEVIFQFFRSHDSVLTETWAGERSVQILSLSGMIMTVVDGSVFQIVSF